MEHYFPNLARITITNPHGTIWFPIENTRIVIEAARFLLTGDAVTDYLIGLGPTTVETQDFTFEIDCNMVVSDEVSRPGYTRLKIGGELLIVPRVVTLLRQWTVEEVKDELPQVDCLWRGQRCAAIVRGRKLKHAVVSLVNQPEIETVYSWEAVARSLNTGNPLRIW